jgi:hypothetical protein
MKTNFHLHLPLVTWRRSTDPIEDLNWCILSNSYALGNKKHKNSRRHLKNKQWDFAVETSRFDFLASCISLFECEVIKRQTRSKRPRFFLAEIDATNVKHLIQPLQWLTNTVFDWKEENSYLRKIGIARSRWAPLFTLKWSSDVSILILFVKIFLIYPDTL